ncbi:sensor histidine kinase [Candidatus Nomurabacteria bacterium]|nr:sensor histidine kinase [Candidatus Kaiserbacteria bacterium]MCB9814060.1 sensor histidine kinase [Candidatus Nomurabacteria bacterium]
MKIHIPNSAFLGNINAFIKLVDFSNPEEIYITANEKWMSVHPVVLCMIASLGVKVRAESDQEKPILCEKFTATSKHYFERMRLFRFLQLNSEMDIVEHESAGRFIPITQIKDAKVLSHFIEDMIPLLHLDKQQSQSIKYIVSELVRNVLEHSASEHGAFVAAQYHAKTNTVRLGIVDTGVGIKKTISRFHIVKTDKDAIQLALTPGITGTTSKEGGTDYNAGAGLFFTKSISRINEDYFVIYSGDTLFKLLKKQKPDTGLNSDPFADRHTLEEGLPIWNGTVIGVDMTLDDNENFSALLQSIREVYTSTVRSRREKKYKKPKFI